MSQNQLRTRSFYSKRTAGQRIRYLYLNYSKVAKHRITNSKGKALTSAEASCG